MIGSKLPGILRYAPALLALLAPALGFAQDAPVPDKGDTAWMMTSTVLVILMTIPGLALFYGGMARTKNVLSVLMQVFMIFCTVALLWGASAKYLGLPSEQAFMGRGVSGCATSSPQIQAAWQYPALSKVPAEGLSERAAAADFSGMESPKAPPDVSAEALERSGDIFMNNGDLSMAFVQYEKALRMKADSYRIHYKEGLLFLAANQNKEAAVEFRTILDMEPEHAPA